MNPGREEGIGWRRTGRGDGLHGKFRICRNDLRTGRDSKIGKEVEIVDSSWISGGAWYLEGRSERDREGVHVMVVVKGVFGMGEIGMVQRGCGNRRRGKWTGWRKRRRVKVEISVVHRGRTRKVYEGKFLHRAVEMVEELQRSCSRGGRSWVEAEREEVRWGEAGRWPEKGEVEGMAARRSRGGGGGRGLRTVASRRWRRRSVARARSGGGHRGGGGGGGWTPSPPFLEQPLEREITRFFLQMTARVCGGGGSLPLL